MGSFAASMTRMARFSDQDMGRSWKWRAEGSDLGVRDGFHRGLEAELAQWAVVDSTSPAAEAITAMSQAQQALGHLLGLVAGQPEDILDLPVGPAEWPLRQVLRHILETELSFFANTRWSVTRADDQPVAMPGELRPRDEDAPGDGEMEDLTARLVSARASTNAFAGNLGPADLDRPSIWAGNPVDARFRLFRFASHLTEHTIHAEKLLRAVGLLPGEARQMVRAIWSARGGHELRSPTEALERLDRELALRLDSFG